MYGQTEATARMAYLPPDLVATRPEAIGVPIPGGSFRLAGVNGHPVHVGELVYTGPNVMMGYAEAPADLARGAELSELRTGDLARQADDGLWEIIGRLGRYAKLFGLRLDLDHLERVVAEDGYAGAASWSVATGSGRSPTGHGPRSALARPSSPTPACRPPRSGWSASRRCH